MSTLRVSNIEAKADGSSPTVDEKVKITNSQGRVLMQIDGKNTGITTIGINTTGNTLTLDSSQNLTFSGNITAPSFNGGPLSGARNRIINGDMRIDQRNAGVSTVPPVYTLDRWFCDESSDGAATVIRSGIAPVGFTSSLLWTTTTADVALAAAQYSNVIQWIEGFNVSDLNWGTSGAVPVTLSFWVRSSLTGTFSGSIRNGADNRSYVFTYTINSADTWEYETITIPGDTSGTWWTDNRKGMSVVFNLGGGVSYQTTTGSWQTGNYTTASTGSVSVIGTLNATWYVTGVQLEAGTVATPFERRSYGQELALCQRYYFTGGNGLIVAGYHNADAGNFLYWQPFHFNTTMRVAPSVSFTSNTPFVLTSGNTYTFGFLFNSFKNGSVGYQRSDLTSNIIASAEL